MAILLLTIALAPVLILLAYIYFRDKYEKEPIGLLLKGMIAGGLITIPIMYLEFSLTILSVLFEGIFNAAYMAFVVAGFTEETFKFLAVMLIFWYSKEFNEKFDGIVYAVFVSLGFAAVENIMYVLEHGSGVGLLRAITAVPAHLLFGVVMGYYIGLARFNPHKGKSLLFKSIYMPILLHGFYDFILFSRNPILLILFIPYIIYLWNYGLKRIKELSYPPKPILKVEKEDEPIDRA